MIDPLALQLPFSSILSNNFTNILAAATIESSALAWGGAAAVLALTVALHYLKPQSPRRVVTSLLLWRQARSAAPATRFIGNFSRWRTLLLVVAVTQLLFWSAVGLDPQTRGDLRSEMNSSPIWVLIDNTPAMHRRQRLQRSLQQVSDHLQTFAVSPYNVMLCGTTPRTLLRAGEAVDRAYSRIQSLNAELSRADNMHRFPWVTATLSSATPSSATLSSATPSPSRLITTLDELHAGPLANVEDARIYWVALSPPTAEATQHFPSGWSFDSWRPQFEPDSNSGITALGIEAAASGEWGKVDAWIEVASNEDAATPTPRASLAGETLALREVSSVETEPGTRRFAVEGVPANGGLLEVSIEGAALRISQGSPPGGTEEDAEPIVEIESDIDDYAAIRLPHWPPLNIRSDLDSALFGATPYRRAEPAEVTLSLATSPARTAAATIPDPTLPNAPLAAVVLDPRRHSIRVCAEDRAAIESWLQHPRVSAAWSVEWEVVPAAASAPTDTSADTSNDDPSNADAPTANSPAPSRSSRRHITLPVASADADAQTLLLVSAALDWCAGREPLRRTQRLGDLGQGSAKSRDGWQRIVAVGENDNGFASLLDRAATTENYRAANESSPRGGRIGWWGMLALALLTLEGVLSRRRRIP